MFKNKNKKDQNQRRPAAQPSGQSRVFSYYNNQKRTDEVQRYSERSTAGQERRHFDQTWGHQFRQLPITLSIIAILAAFLYSLWLTPSPKVMILAGGTVSRPAADYQAYTSQLMRSSLGNRIKLTVDTKVLADKLEQQYPEITDAVITIPLLGHRPILQIRTLQPTLLLTDNTGKDYYVSDTGRATSQLSTYNQTPSNVIHIIDQSGLPIHPGDQILTKDSIDFIHELAAQMQVKQLTIASLVLPPLPYEIQMHLTGVPYYVKFNTLGDARLQAGAFLAVKDKLTGENTTPAEYIDVRAEDRAYYK